MAIKRCIGYSFGGHTVPPHDLEWNSTNFPAWAMDPTRPTVRCRECDRFRRTKTPPGEALPRVARAPQAPARVVPQARPASFAALKSAMAEEVEATEVEAVDERQRHEYVASQELMALWQSVVNGALKHGDRPANMIFFGPSGSGKSEGAEFLADLVGLPFTKVDAASMTDPESWFGTREVVVEDGASVTKYVPSAFVRGLASPGVTFIDEMNRVDDQHRNVLLPITDAIGRVTNPLTGEVIVRHPHHFIIMAGNRGLEFTGTSAIDPAFTKRAYIVEFDYIDEANETRVAQDATGCDATTAMVFVKFANETRGKARSDPDFVPISTREVIAACRLVARGLSRDLAAKFAIINAASNEGGGASFRQELQNIWNGVRVTREEVAAGAPDAGWKCPTHGAFKVVPAGVSQKTGRPYKAFRACNVAFCDETETKAKTTPVATAPTAPATNGAAANGGNGAVKTCSTCGQTQQPGRTTFCYNCGAVLP